MALAPPRPCFVRTCPTLNCTEHPVVPWRPNVGPPPPRIRGRQLQRLRAQLFARAPWCVHCLAAGRRTRATIRDHVIPLAEGGRDDHTNEQALCVDCSDAKTREESKRGIQRR
ncbi:MAG: HNH endonuclease [Acidobacteriota bacterium]